MKLLIKNAFVVDGSGLPGNDDDVLIEHGIIIAVGKNLPESAADNFFDAGGQVLTPGFIDAHSHSDMSILAAPEATGKISQGITTEIVGNCGLSVFPISSHNREHLEELYRNYNEKITWENFDGYLTELRRRKPTVNIFSLCGHNTLRAALGGYENQKLSASKLSKMQRLLTETFQMGAVGLSSGLLYVPGKFSTNDELIALLKTVAAKNHVYATHLRSEGQRLTESLEETFDLAISAGLKKVHISHLKTSGRNNWYKLPTVFSLFEQAKTDGLTVTADRYPYTESMTQLSVILPAPYDAFDDIALEKFLSTPEHFKQITAALAELPTERWQTVRLVSTKTSGMEKFNGEIFCDIAVQLNTTAPELCAKILAEDAAGAMAAFLGMSEENMKRIIKAPFTACGTDESARPVDYSIGRSHPRGFGSFPRFINFLLRENLALEEIIHKITLLPAQIFGLNSRGLIAPGYAADLALFNLDKLSDCSTFASPHVPASGISAVWVNGRLILQQ
ncbi:MAG: amidohydrolase family protein [Victivallaceae bacterium]